MIITMTTIGYGDMWVRAILSRIVIFFVAVTGAVLFPLVIVAVTSLFEISEGEKKSINMLNMIKDRL